MACSEHQFHKELHAVAVRAMNSVVMADAAISTQQAALDYPTTGF